MYNIVFMGTPDFSVPALRALHESDHRILKVATQPDRPKGRGRQFAPPPVKSAAMEMGYDVLQPKSIKTDDFYKEIQAVSPDVIVVVAFGRILNRKLLDLPRIAVVNIHASLLPKYRGAAPIQWAIINGEKETGVTIMMMDAGLDTGDILSFEKIDIQTGDTGAILHDRLSDIGAKLLIRTLSDIENNGLNPIPQDESKASYAPILKKEDGRIDWSKTARKIEALIRGVTPWPGAYTFYRDKRLKIYSAKALDHETNATPGTILDGFPGEIRVSTGDRTLGILELQGASGKRLKTEDFLRGNPLTAGAVFS